MSGVDHTAFGDLAADGRPDVALVGTFPVGTPPPLSGPDIPSRMNLVMQDGGGHFTVAASHDLLSRTGAKRPGFARPRRARCCAAVAGAA